MSLNILRCPFMTFTTGVSAFLYLMFMRSKRMLHMNLKEKLIGTIELGGTFMSVALIKKTFHSNGKLQSLKIIERIKVNTTSPQETLLRVKDFLKNHDITELGVASFGPLDLNEKSKNYGSITSTPKKQWKNFPIVSQLNELFPGVKVWIDTDVNACAWAEYKKGKHQVNNSLAYVTVGTGVGIGLVVNGKTVHGLVHPEGGHMLVQAQQRKHRCEFHENCVEAYCSNHSIARELGITIEELETVSDQDPVWDKVAEALAYLCVNTCLLVSPEKIVLGGGVMNRKILYPKIQQKFQILLNNYVQHPLLQEPHLYIVEPGLQNDTGLIGAAMLSERN